MSQKSDDISFSLNDNDTIQGVYETSRFNRTN